MEKGINRWEDEKKMKEERRDKTRKEESKWTDGSIRGEDESEYALYERIVGLT